MIDQSPLPSRQLQLFARIARWSLWLLLAFWLLVAAVWWALHGFIVPRIGEWRPEIERMATQALGVPVRIGSVEGQSDGLFPTVQLNGVSVLAPQGHEALKLQKVVATISARSVLRLGLEQLYIDAPSLDIRHLADGQWQIGGLRMAGSESADNPALEWLLALPELVIDKGQLQFTDEQGSGHVQHFHDVNIVLRNKRWSHAIRLDAAPQTAAKERIHLIGNFRDALLPTPRRGWEHWTGQWYAHLHLHQIPQLPFTPSWGIAALAGNGQVRLWLDIRNGQPTGITADVAMPNAKVQWRDASIATLDLHQVHGRLQVHRQGQAWQLEGKNFSFRHNNDSFWPSSNWAVNAHVSHDGIDRMDRIDLHVDYADIAMASQVAQSLPLPVAIRTPLARWKPEGEVRQFDMQWLANGHYQAQGEIQNLTLQPQATPQGVGTPGLQGMHTRFHLNHKGGEAALQMQDGVLHFPGVFEEPAVPLQQLQAKVRWNIQNDQLKVEVSEAKFANADAQGEVDGWWQTGATNEERFPGSMHLQGKLNKANGARVHRYLPLQIPEVARHYVRDSVREGKGKDVEFEVRGKLKDMPFDRPGTGRFYIKAPVTEVTYAFVPASLHKMKGPAWPTLTHLQGDLIFEGAGMAVQKAQSGFEGHPKLHMESIAAEIPNMSHPVLAVHALGKMDMAATLNLVRNSPLADFTHHALDETQAKGSAHIGFDLELPIDHLDQSKVQGNVKFHNTALQFGPETPWLNALEGAVQFSEKGFALYNVHGQSLGGAFKLTGGMPSVQQGVQIKALGTATAQGMQQDEHIPLLKDIASHAQGTASYAVDVIANGGTQQVSVHSDLRGMTLHLPAPFNKPKEDAWPLSIKQSLLANHVQILEVKVPDIVQVAYTKTNADSAAPEVRGMISVGSSTASAYPDKGVTAQVHLDALDVDAWLDQWAAYSPSFANNTTASAYAPQHIQLDIKKLHLKERELNAVKAEFAQSNGIWRGELSAQQFAGYAEYRSPQVFADSGRLFARLTHLSIPKAEIQRLNATTSNEESDSPSTLPALDIEVERFEISDKALGKLVLQARNSAGAYGRDWTLEQFHLSTPEGNWKANGSWVTPAHGAPRMTRLGFLLEINDSGKLLERLGMSGVIRDGKGRLSGNIAWRGSPISPDWQSMDGGIHMQVAQGQFLKVEPGMGKLLSVLSLQSLARRVNLDFRDLFSQGFAFDFIRGDIAVDKGIASTNNLQMRGLNAAVLMEGRANLAQETQDLKVVVVPEINAMTASLAATAINPVVGLGSFLAQMFLRGPLMEAATRIFHIHGTWTDPIVEPVVKKKAHPSTPNHRTQGDKP